MYSVRMFHALFGIVDFVEIEAATPTDAISGALDLKGAGWAAEYASQGVGYVANTYTA